MMFFFVSIYNSSLSIYLQLLYLTKDQCSYTEESVPNILRNLKRFLNVPPKNIVNIYLGLHSCYLFSQLQGKFSIGNSLTTTVEFFKIFLTSRVSETYASKYFSKTDKKLLQQH